MADITTSTTIIDNTHECVFAFQYQYVDGGNESAVAKIDVSSLATNANGETCTGIRILECQWILLFCIWPKINRDTRLLKNLVACRIARHTELMGLETSNLQQLGLERLVMHIK